MPCAAAAALKEVSMTAVNPARSLPALSRLQPLSRRRLGRLGLALVLGGAVPSRAAPSQAIRLPSLDLAALDRLVFVNDRERPTVAVVDSRDDGLLGQLELDHIVDVMAIARGRGPLVTASWDEPALQLVTLGQAAAVTHLPLGHGIEHFQLAPGESLVAVVDHTGDGLSLVALEPPYPVRRVEGLAAPHNIVFAPDGERLYASNLGSDRVSVVELASSRIVEELRMPFAGVTDLALTPDGRTALVLFSGRDEVLVLDLAGGYTRALLTLGALPFHAYPAMAGERLIVPNNGDATISIVALETAKETARLEGAAGMTAAVAAWFDSLAFVPSSEEQRIVVLDLDQERLLEPIPLPGRPGAPALEPSGRKLYVPLVDRGALAVVDAAERRLLGLVEGIGVAPWEARLAGGRTYCH
jgi:DNA-binding beta-propeller fold protein YncE